MGEAGRKKAPERRSALSPEKQRLLRNLEVKARCVIDLKKALKSFSLDSSPEMIEDKLEAVYTAVAANFSPELSEMAIRGSNIQQEIEDLSNRELELFDDTEISDDEAEQELFEIQDRIEAALDEFEKIRFDDDSSFLLNIRRIIENSVNRNRKVQELRSDRQSLRQFIDRTVSVCQEHKDILHDFSKDGVKRISFRPFGICVVLKSDYAREDFPANGYMMPREPLTFIRDQGRQTQQTIRHEMTHSVLMEAPALAPLQLGLAIRRIENLISNYGVSTEQRYELEKQNTIVDPHLFIDLMRNEILAEIENARLRSFEGESFEASDQDKLMEAVFGRRATDSKVTFEKYVSIMSTAGYEVYNFVRTLEYLARRARDPEVRDYCMKAAATVRQDFITAVDRMRVYFDVGRKMSRPVFEEVDALLHLLPLNKYYHIGTYLRQKYGERKIDTKIWNSITKFRIDSEKTKI